MTAAAPALHLPRSLDEALALLAEPGAAPVAGGVGLTLRRHDRGPLDGAELVAVGALPELSAVRWTPDQVVIGAAVRLSALGADPRLAEAWPVLTEAAGSVATARIRELVTLGGNIAAREDSHDPPVALAAAGATATARGPAGERTVPVAGLVLDPGELLLDVRLPLPPAGTGSAFEKFLVRGVWEYACVNVAAVARLDAAGAARLSLAVGSVAGGPVLIDLSDLCGPRHRTATLVAEAADRAAAATRPYDDVRGSAAYKSRMIAEFSRRALIRALQRAERAAGDRPAGTARPNPGQPRTDPA